VPSKVAKKNPYSRDAIGWSRAAAIFGNPKPPDTVWEQQFDGFNEALAKLAMTPYAKMNFSELWYYYLDLAYVQLQPDLFKYLFPVCLMDWHATLMANEPCSHGDSDFHYAMVQGQVFERMLTPEQRLRVSEFLKDSFLCRLDATQEVEPRWHHPDYGWLHRFNSLGLVLPGIAPIWKAWWTMETVGRALAALRYCSGFIYYDGENPLFDTSGARRGGADLWENDSMAYGAGWLEPNLEFLRRTLTADYVLAKIDAAAERLAGHPAESLAWRMSGDAVLKKDLVESRTSELPTLLGKIAGRQTGWSI